jgi:membrane protease YdiL (CAAX protease family)
VDADRGYVIAVLIAAVVAAPVVEELVFRGVVLRGLLSRTGAVLAIALQGALFGAAHVDPVRGAGNLGLALILGGDGVAFGTAAYLFRRIGPTIAAHAIFNAVVLAIVLTGVLDDLAEDASPVSVREAPVVDQAHVAEPHRHHDECARGGH